mmetsp:Transcript_9331/g.16209  ORF Transcript_9331/g.16209 Transcript_9331/m.16209 type:complete len:237 (-) Transcript_9331:1843-2553(-)
MISRSFFCTLRRFFSAKDNGRHSTSSAACACAKGSAMASSTSISSSAASAAISAGSGEAGAGAGLGPGGLAPQDGKPPTGRPESPAAGQLGLPPTGGNPAVHGMEAPGGGPLAFGGGPSAALGFGSSRAFPSKTAEGADPHATAAWIFGVPHMPPAPERPASPPPASAEPPKDGKAALDEKSMDFALGFCTLLENEDMGAPAGLLRCVGRYDAHPICRSAMLNFSCLDWAPLGFAP